MLPSTIALRLLQALGFLWAGVVIGISFLEAPVKFTAPSVTREIGLDVGRHVFAALNSVEIGLGVLLLFLLVVAEPGHVVRWAGGVVLVLLLVQTFWLLPVLSAQAAEIIEGGTGPSTNYAHVAYVVLEGIKVCGLVLVGWMAGP